jgi:sterol desaturase/sphingolipid hydroxylase (fatty acid hydroxylase superfamily)
MFDIFTIFNINYTGLIIYIISEFAFWLSVLFYYLLDKFLPFNFLNRFKYYAPKQNMLKGYNKNTLKLVGFNHLVVAPLFIVPINLLYTRNFYDEMIDYWWILGQFICVTFFQDILFHIHHLILHVPYFYKHIHKVHHEFKEPIGISAHYVHWIEFIVLYYPIITGPLIFKMHPLCFSLWIIIAIIVNVSGHSGYFSKEHFLHHKYFNFNYGSNTNFDRILGTFLKYNYQKHHI